MILDAGSLELVNAIESLLEPAPARRHQAGADGVGARGLDRAVHDDGRGGRAAARAPAPGDPDGGLQEPGDRLGRNAPLRDVGGPADRRPSALPRPDLGAALRRPAGADLRHARARRVDDPGQGHPHRQRDARPRPGAARAVGELALLARRRHRSGLDPHPDLSRLPSGRHPAQVQELGGLRAAHRVHDRGAGDRGLHLPVARRPAPSDVRDGGDPGDGLPDPRRAHARAGRARPGAGSRARRALRRRQAPLELPVRDARREQVAGGAPRARGRAGRPAEIRARTRRGRWPAGWSTACATTARTSAPRATSRRSRTCSSAATGRRVRWSCTRPITIFARSWRRSSRPRSPSHIALCPEPSDALTIGEYEHGRSRSVRDLQELRIRGQSLHHGVPVLRKPPAQARAEDRPPGPRGRAPAPASARALAAAPEARGDPGDPRRVAPVRDDRAGSARAGRVPAVADRAHRARHAARFSASRARSGGAC